MRILQGKENEAEAGGDASVEVFEIAGSIKWFDVSKGYGFIVPDNGLGGRAAARHMPQGRRLSDGL